MSDRFAIVPRDVYRRFKEVKPNAFALYIALCGYRNSETGQCTPTMNEQLQELGLSRTRWYEARADLIEKGWLHWPDVDGGQIDLRVGFPLVTAEQDAAKLLKAWLLGLDSNQQPSG